jgi:hypothetical protein
MRFVAMVLAVAAAVPTLAGQNPGIRIYLDTDPPNHVHEACPEANQTFDVYVCLDGFGPGGGTRGTAFLLERTFVGFKLEQEALLGGLDFGDAEVDGWTIAAGEDCVYPDPFIDVVVVARITYMYLGVPGTLDVLPHPYTGRHVFDCDFDDFDQYCMAGNLGVCMPPNPPEDGCDHPGVHWTRVFCEYQGGGNPTHPPTYWYDVHFSPCCEGPQHGFHVRVYDPNESNYSNWVDPPGWVHTLEIVGDEVWVSWCDPELDDPLWGGTFRFQFDNPNPPEWAEWTVTGVTSRCGEPNTGFLVGSWSYPYWDGFGGRVHAPVPFSSVEQTSWGGIKALYR